MDVQQVPPIAQPQHPPKPSVLYQMFHPTTGTELAVLILGIVLIVGMVIVDIVAIINPIMFL